MQFGRWSHLCTIVIFVSQYYELAHTQSSESVAVACDSCQNPAMKAQWWENTGLNCPTGGDAGLCDICVDKGNTPEATKACQTADSPEECCSLCMQWNSGHLPGGFKPGNDFKCHTWFFRKHDKWCGLKNCDGPGHCGDVVKGDDFVSGVACGDSDTWGWLFLKLIAGVASMYLVGGTLHATKVRGKAFRYPDAVPHLEGWRALLSLCKDGCQFCASNLGMQSRHASRQPLHSESQLHPSSKKRHKHKRHKDKTEQSSSKQDKNQASPEHGAEQSDAKATATLRSVPSGSGGRWVHISN